MGSNPAGVANDLAAIQAGAETRKLGFVPRLSPDGRCTHLRARAVGTSDSDAYPLAILALKSDTTASKKLGQC